MEQEGDAGCPNPFRILERLTFSSPVLTHGPGKVFLKMTSIKHLAIMGRDIAFDPASITSPFPDEARFPEVCALALDVSGGCNLRCAYCAESMTLPRRNPMDKAMLTRAIEALFAWSKPEARLSLQFGNGEPLLQPKLLKAAGKIARKLAKKHERTVGLSLTTNGTLLDDRIIKWLVEDGWEVKVSLDGRRADHDRYRTDVKGCGTYDRIKRQVRRLADKIPDRFSTTAVLCKGSDPARIYAGKAALGVRSMEFVPVAAPPGSSLLPGEKEMNAYRDFIQDHAKKLAKKKNMPTCIRFQTQLRRALRIGNRQIGCGAGRTFFAVGPEGKLYPCYRFVGLERFVLGDLATGPRPDAVGRFASGCGKPSSMRLECGQCWAAPLCNGPCFAGVELLGRGSPPPGFCEMVRADCEAALWLIDKLRVKNPVKLCRFAGIPL